MNKKNNMAEKIRCIDSKGVIKHIPEKLTKMPDYMRKHGLTIDSIPPMEMPKPLAEVNLEVTKNFKHEEIEEFKEPDLENSELLEKEPVLEVKELTKEDYFKILDEKGIAYKKTFGIEKLKELCQ